MNTQNMNPGIKNLQTETLYTGWSKLEKVSFDYQAANGSWEHHKREVYNRGNGAAIMLYNEETKNVILTRQPRIPTYVNGNPSGLMIEACAGVFDDESPEDAIIRETEEETGYRIKEVKKVFEAYTTPGSVTEKLFCYVGAYTKDDQVHEGGGVDAEQENIEVLEISLERALKMIEEGEIVDMKTIALLQYVALHKLI